MPSQKQHEDDDDDLYRDEEMKDSFKEMMAKYKSGGSGLQTLL